MNTKADKGCCGTCKHWRIERVGDKKAMYCSMDDKTRLPYESCPRWKGSA
jgi:hypothetical protein